MPALTFHGQFINLSYSYDGITVYYDLLSLAAEQRELQKQKITAMDSFMVACRDLPFVTEITTPLIDCFSEMKGFRFVHRDDSDHEFYHQDGDKQIFDKAKPHFHFKFIKMLNLAEIKKFLMILHRTDLLTPKEVKDFITQYIERYKTYVTLLLNLLVQEKKPDTRNIIQFIYCCPDNEILVMLHDYLTQAKFDYLRACNQFSKWYGTNAPGRVGKSSRSWAEIEKATALQMVNNVIDVCPELDNEMAAQRAKQFAKSHLFFALKRHPANFLDHLSKNKTYKALVENDRQTLLAITAKSKQQFNI